MSKLKYLPSGIKRSVRYSSPVDGTDGHCEGFGVENILQSDDLASLEFVEDILISGSLPKM